MIGDADDLAFATAALLARVPAFAPILAVTGPLPLRRAAPGFAFLLEAVVSQQVSLASARAILGRLQAAGLTGPAAVAAAGAGGLRACGLPRPKIATLLALADAGLDFDALAPLPDAEVTARLTALPGIGRWTAELYLLSALGRPDVLPAGDLALQEAARAAFGLPERPGERALRALAEAWAPWRAVAARALWAYYPHVKSGKGAAG